MGDLLDSKLPKSQQAKAMLPPESEPGAPLPFLITLRGIDPPSGGEFSFKTARWRSQRATTSLMTSTRIANLKTLRRRATSLPEKSGSAVDYRVTANAGRATFSQGEFAARRTGLAVPRAAALAGRPDTIVRLEEIRWNPGERKNP